MFILRSLLNTKTKQINVWNQCGDYMFPSDHWELSFYDINLRPKHFANNILWRLTSSLQMISHGVQSSLHMTSYCALRTLSVTSYCVRSTLPMSSSASKACCQRHRTASWCSADDIILRPKHFLSDTSVWRPKHFASHNVSHPKTETGWAKFCKRWLILLTKTSGISASTDDESTATILAW